MAMKSAVRTQDWCLQDWGSPPILERPTLAKGRHFMVGQLPAATCPLCPQSIGYGSSIRDPLVDGDSYRPKKLRVAPIQIQAPSTKGVASPGPAWQSFVPFKMSTRQAVIPRIATPVHLPLFPLSQRDPANTILGSTRTIRNGGKPQTQSASLKVRPFQVRVGLREPVTSTHNFEGSNRCAQKKTLYTRWHLFYLGSFWWPSCTLGPPTMFEGHAYTAKPTKAHPPSNRLLQGAVTPKSCKVGDDA